MLISIVIVLAFTLFYLEYFFKNESVNFTVHHSSDGVWDLTEYDFSDTVVMLSGEVLHIEGELLTPSEFNSREDEAKLGMPIDHNTARTAKLSIIMPEGFGNAVSVSGDYARAAYINNNYAGSIGVPAENKEDFVPSYGKIMFPAISDSQGNTELIIHGGNFVHKEGSNYSTVYISNQNLLNWYFTFNLIIESFTAALLFCIFLLLFSMMFITKNYRINICFSLLCFLWALRLGLTGSKFLYTMIPNLSWYVAFRLEYISLALTIALLLKIVLIHLKKIKFLKPLNFITYPLYLLSISYLFMDTYVMSYTVPVVTLTYIALILYICIVVLIYNIKNRRKIEHSFTDKIFFIGLSVLFICSVNDALYYNNIHLIMSTLTETAVLIFSFFEAIVIFHLSMLHMEKIKITAKQDEIKAKELEHFLELKSHFLGVVAHEIKTPLSVIMGLSVDTLDIVRDDFDFEHTNFDYINDNQTMIVQTVKNLNETVFDLVDTTALETGRLGLNISKMNMNNLIKSVLRQYKTQIDKNNNTLVLDIDYSEIDIFADERRLRQVLLNLLSNACKHAPSSTITLKLWHDKDFQYVSVSDNGDGIEAEMLETLKNEYNQNSIYKYSGGIGLYISHQIIMSHKGKIEIQSKKGIGTQIEFSLPIKSEKELCKLNG